MRRRSYLSITATALPLVAGCTGSPTAGSSTNESTATTTSTATPDTTTSTETYTTQPRPGIELGEVLVQPGVVLLQTDYLTVHSTSGQYLLVDVTVTEGEAPHDEFVLRLGDTTHSPLSSNKARRLWRVYDRGEYTASTGGILVFELPDGAASPGEEAVLECLGWNTALPDAIRTRLAQGRASFSVDIAAPSPLTVGESPRLVLTVENTADVAGRFLAAINRSGPLVAMRPAELVSVPIDGGAEREIVHEADRVTGHDVPDDDFGDGERDLTFYVNLPGNSREFGIAYEAQN